MDTRKRTLSVGKPNIHIIINNAAFYVNFPIVPFVDVRDVTFEIFGSQTNKLPDSPLLYIQINIFNFYNNHTTCRISLSHPIFAMPKAYEANC